MFSQNQNIRLDVKRVFNIENLPVGFASLDDDDTTDRAAVTNAISQLAEIIWKKGGFRFWHAKTDWKERVYVYFCSQDAQRARKSVARGQRDTPRIERFLCQSRLSFRLSFESRTLAVSLQHTYHTPYADHQLSEAALEFIQARTAISTPAEIYRDLQAVQVPGWESITSHQVYYQWQQLNSKLWRRDQDSLKSAQVLLSEYKEYTSSLYFAGNMRGLAFYISDSLKTLAPRAKELAIDATFGTNNIGMHLFAVLAELDGTGIPLAYCFMDVFNDNSHEVRRADPGATTALLNQFLQPLRDTGFNPTFFGTDKDLSEIAAIGQVWPNTSIQLCYWHARRAVRTKLTASRQTNTQGAYKPAEAQKLIPDLEICWGSISICRPNGDHRYGRCDCPSRLTSVIPQGRIETARGDEQTIVLDIFSRHFNSHSLIPDQSGIYRSAERIHRDCAAEMYHWCRAKNYFRLWAYLWVNWYQPDQWRLWARSVNEKEIPILKTTMIVESHWRKIKHDYLHRFNRPRIDLVIWVLLSRLIPSALARMQALLQHNHRHATASWRKDFKNEWKRLNERLNEPVRLQQYHTDPIRWTCGCLYFLSSRFLSCKHILSCYEPVSDPVDFFRTIQRRRNYPFWTHQQLVLQPQYRPLETDTEPDKTDDNSKDDKDDGDDADEDADFSTVDQDQLIDLEDDSEEDFDAFAADVQSAMDIVREQRAKGNSKFVQKFIAKHASIRTLVQEVKVLRNQRTMGRTWAAWKHPATMYYN
jgi:hypothetical protein